MADPAPISRPASSEPASPAERGLAGRTILQVVPALDAGGVERTAVDVAAAVVRAGGRSLVISAGGRLEAELAAAGAQSLHLPLDRRSPAALISNALKLKALIAAERIDLVHARSRAPAWSALMALRGGAGRRAGVRFVTTYAGIYNAGSALKRGYNGVMARGDAVIANSAFTREHLLGEHGADPARVTAIPRGLDLTHFDAAAVSADRIAAAKEAFGTVAASGRTMALLAGRLTRWKGQALAIAALAEATRRGGDLGLVLAGDAQGRTGYEAELRALARPDGQSRTASSSSATGRTCRPPISPPTSPSPRRSIPKPSVAPPPSPRPWAAQSWLPTTAPRERPVQDGVSGMLVPPGDVEAWAAALLQAAAWSGDRRHDMGRLGRERVRARYSVAAMTDATLAVYAGLLADRPRR